MTDATTTDVTERELESGTDPGAEFVPGAAPDATERVLEPVKVDVGAVKRALRKGTGMANEFAGERVGANLEMSDLEAGLIAPGVVRYLEARPQLAAAAIAGGNEYLQLVVGAGVYSVRVAKERTATLAARAELEDGRGAIRDDAAAAEPLAYSLDTTTEA